jgi:hypothetical protein
LLWRLWERSGTPVWELAEWPWDLISEGDQYLARNEHLTGAALITATLYNIHGGGARVWVPRDFLGEDLQRQTPEEMAAATLSAHGRNVVRSKRKSKPLKWGEPAPNAKPEK